MTRTPGLARIARNLESARQRLDTVMNTAADAAIAAYKDGTPETQIAEQLGVNRLTVRRWLGK
jgi:DNA-binding transcriptional regulator LsrR (DeoR family)